jgi:hypothetical protein
MAEAPDPRFAIKVAQYRLHSLLPDDLVFRDFTAYFHI